MPRGVYRLPGIAPLRRRVHRHLPSAPPATTLDPAPRRNEARPEFHLASRSRSTICRSNSLPDSSVGRCGVHGPLAYARNAQQSRRQIVYRDRGQDTGVSGEPA